LYLHDSFQLWRRIVRHDAVGVHFDLGLRAFEQQDVARLRQNRIAIAMLPEAGTHSVEHLALSWRLAWLEDRRDEALSIARAICDRYPEDPDGTLELAQILFDLDRPAEAVDVLMKGVAAHREDADLWFELGVAAERIGRDELRHRAFYEVWRLEHDDGPEDLLMLTDEMFVAAVEKTLDALPPAVQEALGNIAILVEDYPDEWVVADDVADPRILGLFIGPTTAEEGAVGEVHDGPSRIYIYRWNIERQCRSPDEVEAQVQITVLHEIGHYLGLDEDALFARGLS
jgi:predicted Zn-dependent protease with MMP-like domain